MEAERIPGSRCDGRESLDRRIDVADDELTTSEKNEGYIRRNLTDVRGHNPPASSRTG
jgi:hypothetical protein